MPGEIQEVGQFPAGRSPKTEGRTALTGVSNVNNGLLDIWILHHCDFMYLCIFLTILFSFCSHKAPQSELSDPDTLSFDTMFQPAEAPSQMSTNREYGYGYSSEPSLQMDRPDDFSAPGTTDCHCMSSLKKCMVLLTRALIRYLQQNH